MKHGCLICPTVSEGHSPTCCEAHRQTLQHVEKILEHHAKKRDPQNGADRIFLQGWYAAVKSIRDQLSTKCTFGCKDTHLPLEG